MAEKTKINTDVIHELIMGLEELKLFAVIAEKLSLTADGVTDPCPFDWRSFREKPEWGPESWARDELLPFLATLKPRLTAIHDRLEGALEDCWDHFDSIERSQRETEKAGA
jgi:hypothetical protein